MDAPNFIFELFQNELENMQKTLIRKIANKYKLDEAEIINEFIPTRSLKLVPNTKVSVVVKKKLETKQVPESKSRCVARVWNRGKGGQCTRLKHEDCEFCTQHKSNRKHGRIDEKADKTIFPQSSYAVYK
jgi:hypothetical protein